MKSPHVLPVFDMNASKGFSLIEVLVTIIVLAVGLLGLASLQVLGLKNNQSAYSRSQATQLAYDLSDRMRTNPNGLSTYTTVEPDEAAPETDCTTTTGCSSAEMAENDLFEWYTQLSTTLPDGSATIAVSSDVYTITITWDDDRDGNANNNPSFQTSFRL